MTLIAAHILAVITVAAPAQTVSAYAPPASRAEMEASVASTVQGMNTVSDASGNWAITFAAPFASTSPIIEPHPVSSSSSLPVVCRVLARSATSASGDCMQSTPTTLTGTLTGLLGSIINPFGAKAPNTPVMIIAREPTQGN